MKHDDMSKRFDEIGKKLDSFTKTIGAGMEAMDRRVTDLESTVKRMQRSEATMTDNLTRALNLMERLTNDNSAVLRRMDGRIALDSQRVRGAAHDEGFSRLEFLRQLDRAGKVDKEQDEPYSRYTQKIRVNGAPVRAIIIIK